MTTVGRISRLFSAAFCFVALCFFVAEPAEAQTYTVVYSFAGAPSDGAFANGELIQDAAGNLYGTTVEGGTNNWGTIFKLDSSGNETILYNFTGGSNDGGYPMGGLLRDVEGNLYGTTSTGTDFGGGALFELDTSNTFKRIFKFGLAGTGNGPRSRLVTINGDLYGVTTNGGLLSQTCQNGAQVRCGIIYKMTKGGTETVLYRFTGGADGAYPQNLIRDAAGNLYGVALSNPAGTGTIWKLDASGVFSVLYTFSGGADGGNPMGRLIRDSTKGTLRGTTSSGGDPTCNCGVVYSLDSSDVEGVIHRFFGGGGGSYPSVGLLNVGGTLYGTTDAGGDSSCFAPSQGCGVVYQVGRTGQYTVLHRFTGSAAGDGDTSAIGALTLGEGGNVYGATWYGGTGRCTQGSHPGCGIIFRYTP